MSRQLKRVIAIALIAIQVLTSHGASVFAQDFGKQFTGTLLFMKEQGDNQSNNVLSEKEEVDENGLAELAQANEEEGEKEKLGEGENVNDEKLNEEEPSENEEKKEEPQEEPEVEKVSETEDEEEETAKESIEGESEEETSEEETSEKETSEKETTEEETSEEETTAEESKENIASASDALYGDDENTFTLTYNWNDHSNGGKGSTDTEPYSEDFEVATTKIVKNGEQYGLFEHMVYRKGYELLGYSFERDGELIEGGEIVDLTEDKTIYAIWNPRKYKIYLTSDILVNGVQATDKEGNYRSIEFTFDENIMDTIKKNGLSAHTKETKPEVYDCLEFLGWSFNGSSECIKDEDNFTNPDIIKEGYGGEGRLCALYYQKYIHVKLNAGDMGYYLDEGAEDIEENRKKILDLGYCEPGVPLYSLEGFKEPIPYKNFRFEKWWVPFIPEAPQDPKEHDIIIATGGYETYNIKEEDAQFWNEEYVAHYEEDRYPITLNAGGKFYVSILDVSNIAYETGVYPDDSEKYVFTDRLGKTKGGGTRKTRTIYALKGKTIAEALEEAGFEAPVAYDRNFLGWQEGKHPNRENNKYVGFNAVDFNNIIIEGPMEFTAVWRKKPLKFTFKKGPNMYFESGRDEFTIEFPARDIKENQSIFTDMYAGNIYDIAGYEDPLIIDDNGERNDYDYEFVRWEDDEEFLDEKTKLDTVKMEIEQEPVGWEEDKQQYAGLAHLKYFVRPGDVRFSGYKKIFEDGEYFYVDKKGRKYADPDYGMGESYREEPYVFTPLIRKIPMSVQMFSPFPVFDHDQKRQDLVISSGTPIGDVDQYKGTDFSKVEAEGYHFAGWYQIDHAKIHDTLINFKDVANKFEAVPPLSVDDIEEYFGKGMPTIVGFAKPGLDTWFKYVQCTRTDDLSYAAGQWFKKIDGEVVINRDSALAYDPLSNYRSKKIVRQENAIDIIALFTANLTLDAGDGKFADGTSEKTINEILIDTITPIREYKGIGYEVPTPSDASKTFAGWRLVDENGKDVRYFGDHEAISKDTRLVASYINAKDSVKLTLKLHGAETIEETLDEDNNIVYNVVEMSDVVMMVPQGVKVADIEKDIPSFYRKGYQYSPIHTNQPAWFYEYKDGEYSDAVTREDVIDNDTTIHLQWTVLKYAYRFYYEIDGKEDSCGSITGELGQKLKDANLFALYSKIFDFSLENQPRKGYKITGIKLYGDAGIDVTPETVIEGHINCKVIVEPLDTVITFDANGGELIGNNTLTVPYATYYKDIKDIVPRASRSDLSFVGWIDDKSEQVTDDYRIATSYDDDKVKQAKFTAQWTDAKATLIFDAGEGKFEGGSNTKMFENVPKGQIIANIVDGERKYEEPTAEDKVFDRWIVELKYGHDVTYTKEKELGYGINDNDFEREVEFGLVFKAVYVDKTVTFSIKCSDPSNSLGALTFAYVPKIKEKTIPHDYVLDSSTYLSLTHSYCSGGTWVQTVKEGMTFGQWFDYIYKQGYRYRGEYGYALCGWKYEEPASINGPRKNTKDMIDVDMTAPIKNGDVFTAYLVKGSFTVRIDANGGTYGKVADKETSSGVLVHQDSNTLMVYGNVPAGTAADKISGMVMPRRSGYTLVGYSRKKDLSGKILASNVFVSGDEYLYAIWSVNGNQYVQPTVNMDNNSNSGNGGGGAGGAGPLQNVSAPRTDIVNNIGPESGVTGDGTKQFTQTNVSEEVKQQSAAQTIQLVVAAGISADAANTSQVQQAVAEVQAGMNIAEQYAQMVSQITANPSAVGETTAISHINLVANTAHWHTDANGNVTLEAEGYSNGGFIKDVWQAVTNDAGQTGWYKFDANGYMQTGLVQDGNCTYYLSEERGAGYGQMVCNQTITIGGLTMTFNANGALTDMQYSAEAAVKAIQDAATAAQQGQAVYLENTVEANSMV